MYIGLHVKHLLFLPNFKQNQHLYRKFDENPKYQSSQTSVQWSYSKTRSGTDGQTDRQRGR